MMTSRILRHGISALLLLIPLSASALEPDWKDYRQLLENHVSAGTINGVTLNVVDYEALKASGEIDKVAAQLSQFSLDKLQSREEKLAFYINAYNILAIKMVTDNLPVKSIRSVGNVVSPVWKKPAGSLGGKVVTLHEVEHEILRPMGEPRIHFAIVCASVSCPDLSKEPFTAGSLTAQLDKQTRLFLANSGKGLRAGQGQVSVSRIFDWFSTDFEKEGGVEGFIRRYKPDLPGNVKIRTNISYDWALNARQALQ